MVALEGASDEGAIQRVLQHCGGHPAGILGRSGKTHLLQRLGSYNAAAAGSPWLVVVDLDNDFAACAVDARAAWLPTANTQPGMCFRIAVREIEAWLLADAEAIADFLGVARTLVPAQPEGLPNPKQEIVKLARKSRKRAIREGMVPRDGSGAVIGPTYVADLNEFASSAWRPMTAAMVAPSLAKFVDRMCDMVLAYSDLDDGS